MKILMLLSNPFMVDPRVYNEAKALTDNGHEVTVVVWDRRHDYESRDVVDGIKLIRLHNNFLMRALPNNLFRNPMWWKKSYRMGLKLYKDGFDFDVVHCHDLDTLRTGVRLKKKLGCKLVYDAHEIFGYMIEGNVPQFVVNFVFRMEKKLVKNADHVITVNEPLKKYFKKITNVPITIVMNCKDLVSERYKPPKNKIFTASFVTSLSKKRLLPEIIDILGKTKNIRFVIAGKKENIKLYHEVEKTSAKYENVDFLGQIAFDRVVPETCKSNVVLCPVNPSATLSKIGTANKQFDAMTCGRPIICTKNTYSGDMTEELQCGLVVDYNLNAIKEAIIKLRDDPQLCEKLGKNGLDAALKKYNWEKQEEMLLKIYKQFNNKNNGIMEEK